MTQGEALALSLVIEVPVALGLSGPVDRRRLLFVALAATLLSHPFAMAGFVALRPWLSYPVRAALVEGTVAGAEGLLYWRVAEMPPRRAFAVGLAANGASYLTGLALHVAFG